MFLTSNHIYPNRVKKKKKISQFSSSKSMRVFPYEKGHYKKGELLIQFFK